MHRVSCEFPASKHAFLVSSTITRPSLYNQWAESFPTGATAKQPAISSQHRQCAARERDGPCSKGEFDGKICTQRTLGGYGGNIFAARFS